MNMIERKSVLEGIKEEFGDNVSRKIQDELAYKSNFYILYLVDIYQVTEEDLRIGFASYQARYPERSYEDYLRFKSNWNEDKYTFIIEPQGYFLDKATAVSYTKNNVGDINEAGAYPYVIVSSMPLNCVYPTCNTRDHTLFHFNKETEKYEEIGWDFNEGTKYLQKRAGSGVY